MDNWNIVVEPSTETSNVVITYTEENNEEENNEVKNKNNKLNSTSEIISIDDVDDINLKFNTTIKTRLNMYSYEDEYSPIRTGEKKFPGKRIYPESLRGLVVESDTPYTDDDIVSKCKETGENSCGGINILSYGFPKPYEYTIDDNLYELENLYNNLVENKKENKKENIRTFMSYEGTLIRLVYHMDDWMIMTNRKLSAFDSYWSCDKNFGELFVEYIFEHMKYKNMLNNIEEENRENKEYIYHNFMEKLNTNFEYVFLLKSNEQNRIVHKPEKVDKILYICHIEKSGEIIYPKEDENIEIEKEIEIEKSMCGVENISDIFSTPEELSKYYSFEEILETVEDADEYTYQGVILFIGNNIKDLVQYKIYNKKYKYLYDLRANTVSVLYRYIELYKKGIHKELLDYHNLYIEKDDVFYFDYNLNRIINYVYKSYVDRYIYKKFVMVPVPFYKVMQRCHEWHLEDRKTNKINKDIVKQKIFDMDTAFVTHLFRVEFK